MKLASVLNLGDIAAPNLTALALSVALAMLTILIVARGV